MASDRTDLQRMKLSTPAAVEIDVTNSSRTVIPANPNRVALILPSSPTQVVTWRWGPLAVAGRGLHLAVGAAPIALSLALHGALVLGPWSAITGTGAETLAYHEATLSRD